MSELKTLWLPLAVAGLAVLVLLADVMTPPSKDGRRGLGWLVAVGLAGIFAASYAVDGSGKAAQGVYEGGAWTVSLQRLFLLAGVIAALGAIDDVAAKSPRRAGEYWLILLFSLLGMVILPGARDLVLIVVAFELMGAPLYVLAAYAKSDAPKESGTKGHAAEAAVKLYLVGATSSAVTLFGLALVTGMAGTTRVEGLGIAAPTPLSSLGLVMVLAGLGYKIGMVPFHMWVPDTYQGARTPFVAFLSVAPKAAGVAAIAIIFLFGMGHEREQWLPALSVIAFLSMAVGNLLALPQTDLRRLLAYSGIAQMGYVLVGLASNDSFGAGMTLFFLTAYMFTNMGAFLVLHAAAEAGGGHTFDSLAGLSKRAPGLAAALLAFLLSLAGIPFVVGFWAKLYVLLAAWHAGQVTLVVSAIVLAVMGLFYYLRMLRAAYMVESAEELPAPKPGLPLRLAIGVCLVAVVVFGLWPKPLIEDSTRAGRDLLDRPPVTAQASLRR